MKRRFLEIRFIGLILIFVSVYPFVNTAQDEFEKRCLLLLYDHIGQRLNKIQKLGREYQFSEEGNRIEFENKFKEVERELTEVKTLYLGQGNKPTLSIILRVLSFITGVSYLITGLGAVMVKYWTRKAVYVSICLFGVWQGVFWGNFCMKLMIFYQLFSQVHSLGMSFQPSLEQNISLPYLTAIFSSVNRVGWLDEILYQIFFYLIVPLYFFNLHKIKMQFELKRKYG